MCAYAYVMTSRPATTTARVATPSWWIIPAGTEVTVIERTPGHYAIREGRRVSALMTAAQVAAVTTI